MCSKVMNIALCRINVLSVACGMEHTLALCSDGVGIELLNANFIKYDY